MVVLNMGCLMISVLYLSEQVLRFKERVAIDWYLIYNFQKNMLISLFGL